MRWIWKLFNCGRERVRQEQIIGVDLGPNDTLVLLTQRTLSEQAIASIKKRGEEFLKSDKKIMVLGDGMTFAVIHRKRVNQRRKVVR